MRPVQFILAIMLVVILVLYFSRFRSGILDRLVVVVFALLGVSMIIAPNWTNWAANLVGVGRGADLFIYLSIVGFAFIILLFYSKIRSIEASITDLARAVAVERAVGSTTTKPGAPDKDIHRDGHSPTDSV